MDGETPEELADRVSGTHQPCYCPHLPQITIVVHFWPHSHFPISDSFIEKNMFVDLEPR